MITRIVIDAVQSPAFGGASFGAAGCYEKLVGRAFGELDPKNPLNAVIVDIELAPQLSGQRRICDRLIYSEADGSDAQ